MPETTQIPTPNDQDAVCLAIVETVAEVTDTPPNELSPLYESINLDALANLFEQPSVPEERTGMVAFEMDGCTVTVSSAGAVSVTKDTTRLTDLRDAEPVPAAEAPDTAPSAPDQMSN